MRFWTTITLILVLSAIGLTYEIAAGRVLAPFFGTSLVTWTSVIATILTGFSLGSALGGLVAERDPAVAVRSVRLALVATAALMAASPAVLGLIYALGARDTGGMLLAVILAFFPASVLVSFPSPFLAKMAVDARPGREGSSLGMVLAAGSLGAIAGAVLAGFVTLPLVGSVATFAGCGAGALICAALVRAGGKGGAGGLSRPDAVIAVAAGAVAVAAITASGPLCRYESGMSCIDVQRHGGAVRLYSDRTQQAAERVAADGGDRLTLAYTDWIWSRMDRDLGAAPSVLFIGGGGYSLPAMLLESRADARAVAVEIDPLITRVVRDSLPWAGAMIDREEGARLGIVHADGRVFLNRTEQRFDAVVMDAFSSGSVPAHLATRETYARLRDIVDGPVYVNLIDAPDGPLARGIHAILSELYPYVQAVQGPVSDRGLANIMLAAADAPLGSVDAYPAEYGPVRLAAGRAFTDDRGWIGHR
ncbi:fused MFS/spermidine synthase [Paracoccus sp. (in: a-proteobacteria)]|uniref:fused MFS/spermidine synthase n=1 Tax=Paracoccus sp. TaxID=267 RepID=UPI0027295292|nr:fused MFS/spermidine synthase [Paracoccus sp. (in: a-proteobacteria)]